MPGIKGVSVAKFLARWKVNSISLESDLYFPDDPRTYLKEDRG